MSHIFRVGNCAGFSGDRLDAPIPVVDTLVRAGGPAAIFFEVLGERTVALAQLARRQDPQQGYEPMLERLVAPILGTCFRNNIPILGNFGAANPPAAARLIAKIARRLGHDDLRIAVVAGDDVRGHIDLGGLEPHEADAGLEGDANACIAANAYLGAAPLVQALHEGANVVVAGRTSDPALAIAPIVHHFGFSIDDWDRMAGAAAAGHLLECGSQVCGGTFWDPGPKVVSDPADIGFPIAEIDDEGVLTITKAENTGGLVDERTVKEQLLYELHDPANYITPDVVVDISQVRVAQCGTDRVRVESVRGRPAPSDLKVTACYQGRWLGEGEITVAGMNALRRARETADVLLERLRRRKLDVRARADLIGIASVHDNDAGDLWRGFNGTPPDEIRVRLAVEGSNADDVEQAAREVLALLCCGAAGSGGARWRVTPRILTKSFLVPRERVPTSVSVRPARELA